MRKTLPTSPLSTRRSGVLAPLLGMLALSGCGGGGGGGGDSVVDVPGPSVAPVLDTDRESSASVGPEGGVVSATGADGTEYSLSIPADALVEEAEISLTPILSIDDLPMSGGFIAGVHFEPSGLELFRTATLTVTPPSAPAVGSDEVLAGFVYDEDGENLALALTEANGNSFLLPVHHFSGGGGGAANPSQLASASMPGSPNAFIAQLLSAIQASDTEAAESILRQWYETRVRPRLQAAVSNDEALDRALDEYRRWLSAEGSVALDIDIATLVSESRSLAADAFSEAISRANDLCERNASFSDAEDALLWQRRAESVLPEDALLQNALDRSAVLNELCVQVVFESTSFPQSPVANEPELLQVVVGYAFGDGPTEFFSGMAVNVLTIGATPAGATEVTDDSGLVELTLTPDSGSVQIEVDACIGIAGGAGALTGAFVCQQAFIVRGLVITPDEAEVGLGGTVSFAALLGGTTASVTWSATGGTIDSSGLYTAGNSEGTFQVTATGVDDPSLTATATVRITAEEFDPSLFRGGADGELIDEFGESVCAGQSDTDCVRLRFFFNDPSFVRLEACLVVPQSGDCGGTISEWSSGTIVGNVFTASQHRTITFGSTVRVSEDPCPVRITLSTSPDGTQASYEGQLKNFLANTCGADSTTSFTLAGFTKDL